MHCPDCGTKASAGQKFCRGCGFSLEKVERLIADQKATATEQTTLATAGLSDNWFRRLGKWATGAIFLLCGSLGCLMLLGIITVAKAMIEKGKIFPGIILLMITAGAALGLVLAYLDSARKKSASAQSNQQHRLPQAQETAKMLSEPNAEMAVSVTEQTTANLAERNEA
ncbi:MAG TPA: zinc ribbon domain-containing protein [Blastocatellia bacterium]|nr:zinc ribbon domain-containing protein [Blastocatellia bacterium]